MKIIALIQARMSSIRLPNKVLLPLAGKSVLEHIYERLRHCEYLDDIIVATSEDISDDLIVKLCKEKKYNYFKGSLTDVLDRYYQAAIQNNADAVVRITGDCPLIDPLIVDEVIRNFKSGKFDFFSLSGDFPDGLDCQIFSFDALKKSWKEAKLLSDREHVGTYIERTCPDKFKTGSLIKFKDLGHHRWTLDEPRDYTFLKEIFSRLWSEDKIFLTADILKLLDDSPELLNINKDIIRNQGYQRSLKNDKA